jgi:hypothetical protein
MQKAEGDKNAKMKKHNSRQWWECMNTNIKVDNNKWWWKCIHKNTTIDHDENVKMKTQK